MFFNGKTQKINFPHLLAENNHTIGSFPPNPQFLYVENFFHLSTNTIFVVYNGFV